ncbi:MAG: cation-translocating P-type ATPase [Verrucomicrobia bacterium]|nr:cation-translocating P-type ATPase [Verrucomicrobiota bacterium]
MQPATPTTASAPAAREFSVRGMTCQGCARHVTDAIQGVPGVATATVQLDAGRATVRWKPEAEPSAAAVVSAVKTAGYAAAELSPLTSHLSPSSWSPLEGWRFNVVVGSVVTLVLMAAEWIFRLGAERWFHWLAFALALPVQIFCGARFYRGAWNQLKIGASNMDTLVALGSTTAFGYSLWALLAGVHAHLYFMEAAAIITLISVGHWLEALMSKRAAGALHALMNLAPPAARRLNADGSETETPVAELQIGDRVALKPGDRVPVDGEVLEGASSVDESMLTGEALPVEKSSGAKLFSGTANLDGRLVLRVTATGEATALAQIIAVVQRAQNSRAGIQRLGDRVSSVFVPVVVVIALASGLWWGLAFESAMKFSRALAPFFWTIHFPETALAAAFIHAAGVLIVACPCAMGLATPAALMAGTSAAAKRGILIRDAVALEKSGGITAVLFDKTGTLTQAKPAVVATKDFHAEAEREFQLEHLAAALAQPSNHPLSRAIASTTRAPATEGRAGSPLPAAPRRGEDTAPYLQDWRETRGAGVQANVQLALRTSHLAPQIVRLGSLNWLRECGVDLQLAAEFIGEWTAQGATVLGLSVENRLAGVFALRDNLKDGAAAVVSELQRQGKKVFIITGDHARAAAAIAAQAGIPAENVFAEVRPERKAEIVAQLQQRGERVAFVGDGINDAPALEQADLGIAVARASDVAREAADLILITSDIRAIPQALGLARATLRAIRQNLFWAFFYNAASVPLAALGFLSPVLCAAAMGLSDLVVLGNALRLRRWKG